MAIKNIQVCLFLQFVTNVCVCNTNFIPILSLEIWLHTAKCELFELELNTALLTSDQHKIKDRSLQVQSTLQQNKVCDL